MNKSLHIYRVLSLLLAISANSAWDKLLKAAIRSMSNLVTCRPFACNEDVLSDSKLDAAVRKEAFEKLAYCYRRIQDTKMPKKHIVIY